MAQQLTAPRLAMPANIEGVDERKWRVLTDAVFPLAKSAASIELALDYCRARNLDVMKKPVHIVPMWSAAAGRQVETIWPSINEIEVTAARTGAWAGMDPPIWGETIELTLRGTRTVWRNRVETTEEQEQTFRVPSSCAVTVYRIVQGQRFAFTEPVFWVEAYGRVGNTELANDMWRKRPHGQLHKVAKAASLRAAFPEEGELSAEEMEGQTIDVTETPPPTPPPPKPDKLTRPVEPPHDAETGEILAPHSIEFADTGDKEPEGWAQWGARFIAAVRTAEDADQITAWENLNGVKIASMKTEAPKVHARLIAAINKQRNDLAAAGNANAPGDEPKQTE
jgi:phage recombination protein Bet